MCGIAGIFHQGGRPVDPGELNSFTDSLLHRGPDGGGQWIDGEIGFGHRRLAILDLSEAGACPMPYPSSQPRYWVTFNGEIFNFIELRKELEAKGHRFRGESDTEVLVASYAEWGDACQERFNGMWAFAIWDVVERSLFLSRDRFGIKPLYFLVSSDFYFASEIKAFSQIGNFRPALNEDRVPAYLRDAQLAEGDSEETLLKGVKKLMPGHCMTVRAGQIKQRRWWNTADHIEAPPLDYSSQVEAFRELFLDAVRLRMRSDVSVGTSLSGGLDSSAVACAMHRLAADSSESGRRTSDWRHAFIATFPGSEIDERVFADQVVAETDIQAHHTVIDGSMGAADVVDSVWIMEEVCPVIATPVVHNYRAMRDNGVVVSLDGHGADELLLGYTFHLDWPTGDANQQLYDVFHRRLLPCILRNFDRCSMANGIETRMPIMDWRLVVFAFSLGIEAKAGGGYSKRILRDAVEGMVPDSVRLRRSKIGFNAPMAQCFNDRLGGLLDPLLASPEWLESQWWDGPGTAEYLRRRCDAQDWVHADWDELMQHWLRVNLVLWQRMFVGGERNPFIESGT